MKATAKLSIESMKVELACLYYLGLPVERRSDGTTFVEFGMF